MDLRRHAYCASAFIGSILFIQTAMAGTYTGGPIVGYSGGSKDDPTVTPGSIYGTAGTARTDFLASLGNAYYYEDFQETAAFDSSGSADISSTGLALAFKPFGSPSYSGPVTATLTSTDDTKSHGTLYKNVTLQQGEIGTDTRGAFDEFEPGLDDAIPGEGLVDSGVGTLNQYIDITPGAATYDVTITVAPGYNALGLMLNDVFQPNTANVIVTFSDGTTETLGGLNSKTGAIGHLSTNNTWFLGVSGGGLISTVTIEEQSTGDPITLDNIYLANIPIAPGPTGTVPSPVSALGGGVLFAILAISRSRSRVD